MNTEERLKTIESAISELLEWKRAREQQQISYPLDEASKNAVFDLIKILSPYDFGTASTQNISITSTPTSITVPAQPTGTIKVTIDGTVYELLYK